MSGRRHVARRHTSKFLAVFLWINLRHYGQFVSPQFALDRGRDDVGRVTDRALELGHRTTHPELALTQVVRQTIIDESSSRMTNASDEILNNLRSLNSKL